MGGIRSTCYPSTELDTCVGGDRHLCEWRSTPVWVEIDTCSTWGSTPVWIGSNMTTRWRWIRKEDLCHAEWHIMLHASWPLAARSTLSFKSPYRCSLNRVDPHQRTIRVSTGETYEYIASRPWTPSFRGFFFSPFRQRVQGLEKRTIYILLNKRKPLCFMCLRWDLTAHISVPSNQNWRWFLSTFIYVLNHRQ